MARDEDNYKAGVDFEWVTAKNGNYKTRRFFTKAEKEAMKAPKAEPKPASKPAAKKTTPTSSPRPKSKPASMDAGSRVGAQSRPVKSTAELRASMEKKKPVAKESTGGPARMPVPKGTTYEDWKKMGRGERQRLGLPVSDIGGEIGFKRFLTGITGKEYKMNEPTRPEAPKKPISQMVKRTGFGSQTYSTKGKN